MTEQMRINIIALYSAVFHILIVEPEVKPELIDAVGSMHK